MRHTHVDRKRMWIDGWISSMLDGTLILDKFPQSRVVLQGDFKPILLLYFGHRTTRKTMTETFLPVVQHYCINLVKSTTHACEKKTCNFIFTFQMALMRRGSQTIDP